MNIFKIFKELTSEFDKEIKGIQEQQKISHNKFEDSLNRVEDALAEGKNRIKNK